MLVRFDLPCICELAALLGDLVVGLIVCCFDVCLFLLGNLVVLRVDLHVLVCVVVVVWILWCFALLCCLLWFAGWLGFGVCGYAFCLTCLGYGVVCLRWLLFVACGFAVVC